MEELLLILTVAAVFLFGLFVVDRLEVFLQRYYRQEVPEEETADGDPCPVRSDPGPEEEERNVQAR